MDKLFTINNAKFLIQVILIVVGFTMAWAAINTDVSLIKKDIEIINNNHLSHIQQDITELKANYKEQTALLQELMILVKTRN